MRHVLTTIFLIALILTAHDFLLYRTIQRKAIRDLNACIEETIVDLKKENPSRGRDYFERISGAIMMDCHNTLQFRYLYPKTQGILVYPD